jgi:peptide/nickel transport system substrate-binding protein
MLAGAGLMSVDTPAGAKAKAQQRGGSIVWALEAETDPVNGYCLPRAQLAASGIQVVNAIYDTLTTLNSKGEYVPYLAKSVTPNADSTEWTIGLREGVTFHDGTPVDAEAIKLNIDTYRGANPNVSAPLGTFSLRDIASVTVADPLTVVVTTKVPWVAFPAFLYGTGRTGIVAPAQLANQESCTRNLIGSGPFKLVPNGYRPNESLTVERNDDYWQEGLPYLDKITFRPTPEASQRDTGLIGGDFDIIQTSNSGSIVKLEQQAEDGNIRLEVSDAGAETAYVMLNVSKPPFDDIIARQAVAYAGDAVAVNNIRNQGINTLSSGPFPPDNPAYLKKRPVDHDLKKARQLVQEYERKHGQPLQWEYLTNDVPETVAIAQLVQEQNKAAGIDVSVRTLDQAELIDEVLDGNFQGAGFRNHPGGDPDTNYVWWHSGLPTNFGRINDPEIDRLLDEGRQESDPTKRVEIYKDLNRRFQQQLYNLWSWYSIWAAGTQNDVRGVKGPKLPGGGGRPYSLFAGAVPVAGLYKTS